jgi:hypothetical protein
VTLTFIGTTTDRPAVTDTFSIAAGADAGCDTGAGGAT